MIKIKTFAEKETLEEINYTGNLGEWLDSFNPQWRAITLLPFSVFINGAHVSPIDFDKIVINKDTDIEILTHPYGGIIKSVGKLFGGVLNFAFGWLMPRSRSQNHSRVNTPQGERMELSDLKANQARLGSTVPECFGRHMRFFDYLSEPRRYFKDKLQQEVESILCIGVGDYVVENISVGETNIADLENTSAKVFEPNQDVGEYAHVWHTVKEVGATSSGTAGLELRVAKATARDMQNTHPVGGYTFSGTNGSSISRNDGSNFNPNWRQGVTVGIGDSYEYEQYLDNGRIRIKGKFPFIENEDELQAYFPAIIVDGYLGTPETARIKFLSRSEEEDIIYYLATIGRFIPNEVQVTISMHPDFEIGTFSTIDGIYCDVASVQSDTMTVSLNAGDSLIGLPSDTTIQYFAGGLDEPVATNLYKCTPNGVKANAIEVDFFFPQGLCWVRDDGGLSNNTVELEVVVTSPDLDSPIRRIIRYTDNTNDQIGFTERIDLPKYIEASVSVRRTVAGSNSVQSHSQVTWFGLKAKLPIVSRYKNWTTIGITMQSGGKIATQSENRLNAIVTRILPELQPSGEWSAPKPTRDIASFVRYIAHAIGYDDNDIDMAELLRLHNTYWKPREEYFDYIFDETTVKQALDYAFNAGLSDFSISNGKITPVRDDIRTQVEHSYSSQNVVGDITHIFRSRQLDDFDGVEVEYVDPFTFDKKVVDCKLPGDKGVKLRKVSLRGVTSRQRAWVAGMRLASEDRYVNREFSFKTEMDALNSNYGSFIGVVTESPDMRMSCQILKVEKDHVIVSESVPADYDVFAWRDEQGRYNGEYDIIRIDDNKVYVDLPKKPIVSLNMELPHAYIGKKDHFTYKCLVDEITPNGVDAASVKTSIYDERVYAYDNSEIIE